MPLLQCCVDGKWHRIISTVQDISKLRIQIHSTSMQLSPSLPLCSMPILISALMDSNHFVLQESFSLPRPDSSLLPSPTTSPSTLYHTMIKISQSFCHHFPLSFLLIPLLFLISRSLLLPSLNNHTFLHTVLPACLSAFFWHIWLLPALTAVPWVWFCSCVHTMLSSERHTSWQEAKLQGSFQLSWTQGNDEHVGRVHPTNKTQGTHKRTPKYC